VIGHFLAMLALIAVAVAAAPVAKRGANVAVIRVAIWLAVVSGGNGQPQGQLSGPVRPTLLL
jgi:hypothetical protein